MPRFFHEEAEIEIVGAGFNHNGSLVCQFRLLTNYKDNSGDHNEIYSKPAHWLRCDSGFKEIIQKSHALLKSNLRKGNYMSQNLTKDKSIKELTDLYNSLQQSKKDHIKRFRDKPTAVAKLTELFAANPPQAGRESTEEEKEAFAKKVSEQKNPPIKVKHKDNNISMDLTISSKSGISERLPTIEEVNQTSSKIGGKRKKYNGLRIYPLTKNPRQVGSHGWKNFEIYKDGMLYEDFLAAGGENKHFFWDLKNGFIKAI